MYDLKHYDNLADFYTQTGGRLFLSIENKNRNPPRGNDILNEIILRNGHGTISTQYCDTSEFSGESWAQNYGCGKVQESKQVIPNTIQNEENCDTSYPDVCIPPYPPDLDCSEISERNFKVIQPDPHGFDGDNDGIGCKK